MLELLPEHLLALGVLHLDENRRQAADGEVVGQLVCVVAGVPVRK